MLYTPNSWFSLGNEEEEWILGGYTESFTGVCTLISLKKHKTNQMAKCYVLLKLNGQHPGKRLKKNPVFRILKIKFQSKIAPNYLFYTPENQDSQQDLICLVYILISFSSIQSGGSQSVVPRLATSALSGKLLEMQILRSHEGSQVSACTRII